MPVAYVGAAAAVAGTVSQIANSGGSATSTQGGNPATYIPQAQPAADSLYQQLFGLQSGLQPEIVGLGSEVSANQPQYGQETGAANNLFGASSAVLPEVQNILNTGFDPQNALYNRTQQQVLDQSNAINSMNGIAGTPYGAGVTGGTMSNFNIDWQNNQLSRQLQALQGAGSAVSTGASAAGAGANLANMPVNTQLGQLGSLQGIYGGQYSPLQSYLNLGQGASGLALEGQNQAFGQNAFLGSNLGQSLSALSGAFSTSGNGGPYGGGSSYSGPSDPGAGLSYYSPGAAGSSQYSY